MIRYRYSSLLIAAGILLAGCSLRGSSQDTPPTAQPESPPQAAPTQAGVPPQAPSGLADATLMEVSGAVQATVAGSVTTGYDGLSLHVQDKVVSGADGRARISFPNGSFVRQGPNSSVVIHGVNDEFGFNSLLSLSIGEIWIALTQGTIEVDTPSGVASVRGSYLSVQFNPQTGQLIVTCLEGVCSLANSAGGVFIAAGHKAIISGISAPPAVQEMSDEDFNRWLQNNPEVTNLVAQVKLALENAHNAGGSQGTQHCIVGNWAVNPAALQGYAQTTIAGYGLANFSPSVAGTGSVSFASNGTVTGLGNFTLSGANSVGTVAGPFTLSIGASGAATYAISGSTLQVNGVVKTISGTLQSPLGSQGVDLAGLLAVANQLGFAKGIPLTQTSFTFPFVCSGNQLVLDMNDYAAITLSRTSP